VGRRHRRAVAHQQLLGVGGLVVDRDAHVAESADDRLDRLGVDEILGQLVVDLGVREEAALLALLDQLLELVARDFALLLGDALAAAELAQQLLLARAVAPLGLHGRDDRRLRLVGDRLGIGIGLVEALDLIVDEVIGFLGDRVERLTPLGLLRALGLALGAARVLGGLRGTRGLRIRAGL